MLRPDELRQLIVATANSIGISPLDLATAISYETGGTFNPTQPGPVTKHGRHRGFIQFGESQAAENGVDWNDPVYSQLGPGKAVAKYLVNAGVRPGMGMMDVYSAINAGRVGLYDRSDAAAGGMPGNVADKVNSPQMAEHRKKAEALLNPYAGMADGPKGQEMYPPPVFGSMAPTPTPPPPIDPAVAQYAFGDGKLPWSDRLKNAGKAFDDAMPSHLPQPGGFPGGPTQGQANGLLALTNSPNAIARMLLQRRMG